MTQDLAASGAPLPSLHSPVKTTRPGDAPVSSADPMPPVGAQSGAPPRSLGSPLDVEKMRKEIEEQIRREVREQLASGDPTREAVTEAEMPFNDFNKKLEIFAENPDDPIPGFKLRWVNDDGDRIMRLQMRGWVLVNREEIALNSNVTPLNKDLGEFVAIYAGTDSSHQPMRTYLMKIPNDRYEKMQKQQQRRDDDIEAAIRQGGASALGNPGQKAYVPQATPIKIGTTASAIER